jgi:5'(3')-deoxyribonucleotidase
MNFKEIVYVDMDHVLCDYQKAHDASTKKRPEIIYPQSQYGFFRNLEPIHGAKTGFLTLNTFENIDVYILSAPSIFNPFSYGEKREWVERELGFKYVKKLILSNNKGLNRGSYLIDDHISGNGQEHFQGMILQFGSPEFPNWKTITNFFFRKYKHFLNNK